MGQLVGQGARPVCAEFGRALAVGVPDGAHVDLAGIVVGVFDAGVDVGIADGPVDDAADGCVRPQAIVGVNHDVGAAPEGLVVKQVDFAQGDLAVGGVVQDGGCLLEAFLELLQEQGVVTGVPFEGDVEVEDEEFVVVGNGELRDGVGRDFLQIQTSLVRRGAGVEERVARRKLFAARGDLRGVWRQGVGRRQLERVGRHRPQRDQLVACAQHATAGQKPIVSGRERNLKGIPLNLGGNPLIGLVGREAEDDGAAGEGIILHGFLQDLDLTAADAEGEGFGLGKRPLVEAGNVTRHRGVIRSNLQAEAHAVAGADHAAADDVPGVRVLAGGELVGLRGGCGHGRGPGQATIQRVEAVDVIEACVGSAQDVVECGRSILKNGALRRGLRRGQPARRDKMDAQRRLVGKRRMRRLQGIAAGCACRGDDGQAVAEHVHGRGIRHKRFAGDECVRAQLAALVEVDALRAAVFVTGHQIAVAVVVDVQPADVVGVCGVRRLPAQGERDAAVGVRDIFEELITAVACVRRVDIANRQIQIAVPVNVTPGERAAPQAVVALPDVFKAAPLIVDPERIRLVERADGQIDKAVAVGVAPGEGVPDDIC